MGYKVLKRALNTKNTNIYIAQITETRRTSNVMSVCMVQELLQTMKEWEGRPLTRAHSL